MLSYLFYQDQENQKLLEVLLHILLFLFSIKKWNKKYTIGEFAAGFGSGGGWGSSFSLSDISLLLITIWKTKNRIKTVSL